MSNALRQTSRHLPQDKKYNVLANEENRHGISTENFPNICRFCLIGSSEVKLFLNGEDTFLYKVCTSVLSIMINAEDGLPLNICKQCELKILEFNEFKKSVLEVQTILTNILQKHNELSKQGNRFDEFSDDSDYVFGEFSSKNTSDRKYQCRFCKEEFINKLQYGSHLEIERAKRKDLYSLCTICKKLFAKGKLPTHMKIHTKIKEQKYQCDVCGRNYGTKRNLSRHSLVHTGLPHACEICGQAFREANLLKDHLNIHTGLTPYICNICGSSHTSSSGLRLHKAYKHSGKKRKIYSYPQKPDKNRIRSTKKGPFPCEICGKVYATKATVNYHVLTHSGEKNFQCNDCGKMFANKSILGDHRRIHRLSYKCSYCDRAFAYKASFNTHINSHTGEKPHECHVCGKRYSSKSHLKEHMCNHTGERPYSCTVCGKTFTAKGNLNNHIKTHKKDDIC